MRKAIRGYEKSVSAKGSEDRKDRENRANRSGQSKKARERLDKVVDRQRFVSVCDILLSSIAGRTFVANECAFPVRRRFSESGAGRRNKSDESVGRFVYATTRLCFGY